MLMTQHNTRIGCIGTITDIDVHLMLIDIGTVARMTMVLSLTLLDGFG